MIRGTIFSENEIYPRLLIFELLDCTLLIFRGHDFSIFMLLFWIDILGCFIHTFEPAPCMFSYGMPPPPGSKDNLRLMKYPNIICLYARGQKRSCSGAFATSVCKPVLKQYIIRMLQYIHIGIFKKLIMVLFTICVVIISTPKQFLGLSVSDLQNSTQKLTRQKSVLSKAMVVVNFLPVTLSSAELLFCLFVVFGTLAHISK